MVKDEIRELVERETQALQTGDVAFLLDLWHPDMLWPWPTAPDAHDPIRWDIGFGRYDRKRWTELWQGLFDQFDLVHNRQLLREVKVSEQGDGALAVVDVDILWRSPKLGENHWQGRVAKGYTLVSGEWKLIMHVGALQY